MRKEYEHFLKEKPAILQFLAERTTVKPDGYTYLVDLMAAYRGWRRTYHMGASKLSVNSFARALPTEHERKLMNRGRSGENPARAILGVVVI